MGQHHGDSPISNRSVRDSVFLGLRDTVFCTQCELLSANHSSRCLACGSVAILSLSRVLGGSLCGQQTARLLTREEIDSVVGEVIRWTDSTVEQRSSTPSTLVLEEAGHAAQENAIYQPSGMPLPALQAGVRRCCDLTSASGAAVAISDDGRMVCRARAGMMAPALGVEVPPEGLTAVAIRSRRLWRCNDAEREPAVNQNACRVLGIRSMVIAPIIVPNEVLGVLEVFSPLPFAFDDYHSAVVQFVGSALAVAVMTSAASTKQEHASPHSSRTVLASLRAGDLHEPGVRKPTGISQP